MSQNLHNSIVKLLASRGRWIRAGRDNIVAYLSVQLECGPGQLDGIRQALLSGDEPLHVEHIDGRISRIGLRDWIGDEAIVVEEVPSDLEAAWLRIAELERLTGALQADRSDAEAALQLGQDAELQLADLQRQLEETRAALATTEGELRETTTSDQEEVAALRRQLEGVQSVVRTRTAALQEANARKADAERANGELRQRLQQFKHLEPLLDNSAAAGVALELARLGRGGPQVMMIAMDHAARR